MGRRCVPALLTMAALVACGRHSGSPATGTDPTPAPATPPTQSASPAPPRPGVVTSDGVTALGPPPWPEEITVRVGDAVEFPGDAQAGWTRQDGAAAFPSAPFAQAQTGTDGSPATVVDAAGASDTCRAAARCWRLRAVAAGTADVRQSGASGVMCHAEQPPATTCVGVAAPQWRVRVVVRA